MAEIITKTQRWLDLISVLLGRQIPLSVEEILERVPAYAAGAGGHEKARASVRRMFERDKDELREMGIPLETVDYAINAGRESLQGYRITRRDFYLPYLRVLASGEARIPADARAPSGRGIDELHLTLGEMQDAADALSRTAQMPAFPFAEDARSALQKITFDVEPEALARSPGRWLERPGTEGLLASLQVLSKGLLSRKRVRFLYHGLRRGEATERDVAPYGLFFQRDWYLVGADEARGGAVRVFRVARIERPEMSRAAPRSPDYQVPEDFRLSSYLDRSAWELGEEEAGTLADVEFPFPASAWVERSGEGELVETRADGSAVRRFQVQQPDAFLRWVLGQGGEVRLLGPPELSARLEEMLGRMAALYEGEGEDG